MQHVDDIRTEVLACAMPPCRGGKAKGGQALTHLIVRNKHQFAGLGRGGAVGTSQRPRKLTPTEAPIVRHTELLPRGGTGDAEILLLGRREERLQGPEGNLRIPPTDPSATDVGHVALHLGEATSPVVAVLRFEGPLLHACRARSKGGKVLTQKSGDFLSEVKVKVRPGHDRPLSLSVSPRAVRSQWDLGHPSAKVRELQGASVLCVQHWLPGGFRLDLLRHGNVFGRFHVHLWVKGYAQALGTHPS
eukprot:413070-Amphidinium_carterae.1